MSLVRLSFSIEEPLFERLEGLVAAGGYANRSEFIRDLIRARLVETEWERDQDALGTVTLVYDHHARRLGERLTELQHDHHELVLATTHVHLDQHLCAEVIILRGPASALRDLAAELGSQKGVLHSDLTMSSTGRAFG